ncbi:MAG: alpha/beta fold hydrolase, partial [Weeksellaceae bacterium]
MHYRELGKGETVVLLHGFLENHKMWNEFATILSKDYHLIIPDLLGHGDTPTASEKHTMEMQAEHVINILNHKEIESATFIGHSMGGYISMAIARDYPEKVKGICLFFSNTLPDTDE